jgi:hypothetical protein
MNSVYALFEIIFPRTEPLPFLNIIPIVILLALYLALAYLTYYTQGFYTYGFLDLQKNSSGVVAAFIIGILEKKLGMTGKFSRHGGPVVVNTDEEVGKGVPMQNMGGS